MGLDQEMTIHMDLSTSKFFELKNGPWIATIELNVVLNPQRFQRKIQTDRQTKKLEQYKLGNTFKKPDNLIPKDLRNHS